MIRKSPFFSVGLVMLLIASAGCASTSTSPSPSSPGASTSAGETPGPNLAALLAKGTLNVGTSFDFQPYEFIDEDGNKVGFDIDVMDAIAAEMGLETSYTDMPFDTLIPAIQSGTIDLSISTFRATAEREEIVLFSKVYAPKNEGWFGRADSTITMTSSEDAAEYSICVLTGGTDERWINDNLVDTGLMPAENLHTYERQDAAMQDLVNGQCDLHPTESNVGLDYARKNDNIVKLLYIDPVLGGNGYQIPMPLGWEDVKAAIDAAIDKLEADGTLNALGKKWELAGY